MKGRETRADVGQYAGANAWRNELLMSRTGAPKPLLANAITALRGAGALQNVLAFDVFAVETVIDGTPPWCPLEYPWVSRAWSPQDDLWVTDWMQKQGIGVPVAVAAQAVEAVARDRSFHPVVNYLGGLEHDGRARANTWLSTYLGADDTPYTQAVGRAMLIAAVARIYDPGCKVDTVPILEGGQGVGKSTAIRALFDPWFTDELADLGSKDASMQTRGVWGIEVSELDAMSRAEASKIKAFISRTTDRFRPPYGIRLIESQRSCVFWGSTNSDSYLKDETGGRRFWPVKTCAIDIDGLRAARGQLWAEAQILYFASVPWWLVKDEVRLEAEQQQSQRYIGDPWDDQIKRYVAGMEEVTVTQVLLGGIGLAISCWGQAEQNRVARCLRSLGMVRRQKGTGAQKAWIYTALVPNDGSEPGSEHPSGSGTTLRLVPARRLVT
jgi:predicted P-loop ATPase